MGSSLLNKDRRSVGETSSYIIAMCGIFAIGRRPYMSSFYPASGTEDTGQHPNGSGLHHNPIRGKQGHASRGGNINDYLFKQRSKHVVRNRFNHEPKYLIMPLQICTNTDPICGLTAAMYLKPRIVYSGLLAQCSSQYL